MAKKLKEMSRGVLPYLGHTGIGYGFWPRCPKQGIQFDLPLS